MKKLSVFLFAIAMVFITKSITVAAPITINASVDGTISAGNDGIFDTLDTGNYSLGIRQFSTASPFFEDRALLEFDISTFLPGETITSVSLIFDQNSYTTSSTGVDVFAYSGDGILSTADATTAAAMVGSYNPTSGNGVRSVKLDTVFIQSLIGSSNYFGVRLQGTVWGVNTSLFSLERPIGPSYDTIPHLYIEYTPVPIPAAVWLLGSGIIGLVGFMKKFQKP